MLTIIATAALGAGTGLFLSYNRMTGAINKWDDGLADMASIGKVTVLMPTLNEAATIESTLATLRSQNILTVYPEHFEFVVADSESEDGTASLAASLVDRVITVSRGKLTAIDEALSQLDSDIIVAVDADSQYGCNFLNLLLKHFEEPEVVGVSGVELQSKVNPFFFAMLLSEQYIYRILPRMMGRGCYAEGTEVLTQNGWKNFSDLQAEDTVCTLNPETRKIEYQNSIRHFVYDCDEELVRIQGYGKSIDLLVTSEHKFFVEKYNSHSVPRTYIPKFVSASELASNDRIPRIGVWVGEEKEHYQIGQTKVKIEDWLAFFGIWLAEGWCSGSMGSPVKNIIGISQVPGQKREQIKQLLEKLPWGYDENGNCFLIHNEELWAYLKQFGNKYQKHVPNDVKNLSSQLLKILCKWMILGDGHTYPAHIKENGSLQEPYDRYWTASKKLADDIQEIGLKIGFNVRLITETAKDSLIRGRKVSGGNTIYELRFRASPNFHVKSKYISKEKYKGKVYCIEVPNHIIYVRYNGVPSWCGNCAYRREAYAATGGFDLSINQKDIYAMIMEEEIGFYARLSKVGKVAREYRAAVVTTDRRNECPPGSENAYCQQIAAGERF